MSRWTAKPVTSVDSIEFQQLCQQLNADRQTRHVATEAVWPARSLEWLGEAEVYRWFLPQNQGGLGWSNWGIARAYLDLSAACLATTFILTQRVAALRRIGLSPNSLLLDRYLSGLLDGTITATVGISHLTTSRQHVDQPAVSATGDRDIGFQIQGAAPWVTGANATDRILVGASLDDGQQVLTLVDSQATGVSVEPGFQLLALTETHTGRVQFQNVKIDAVDLVAGPVPNVLASLSQGPSSASLHSSALALGLSRSAIDYLESEAAKRSDLERGYHGLLADWNSLVKQLEQLCKREPDSGTESLRSLANSLALRATQGAMVAAKGAGFVAGHPVGRWCREAMFFLVWSCPQAVREANLCELAGIGLEN